MNQLITGNERVRKLTTLCLNILSNNAGKSDIVEMEQEMKKLVPIEVISIVEKIIEASEDTHSAKMNLSKVLNVLHTAIRDRGWEPPKRNSFLKDMIDENAALKTELNSLKKQMKTISKAGVFLKSDKNNMKLFMGNLLKLEEVEYHYVKMENIFFPILEKNGGNLKCLQVMWSIHDDVRRDLKAIRAINKTGNYDQMKLMKIIGRLFFSIYALIFREEYILFPAATEILTDEIWEQMYAESFDIGFSFIEKESGAVFLKSPDGISLSETVDLGTGRLKVEDLILILNSLPLDMTFVDQNDKVAFFSESTKRIFTRSKAVLGREVRNCHPPESVDKVEKILSSFRDGKSSKESFRINYRGRYILIEYFAVRDKDKKYLGTLEVTSDITEINKLYGEKRL